MPCRSRTRSHSPRDLSRSRLFGERGAGVCTALRGIPAAEGGASGAAGHPPAARKLPARTGRGHPPEGDPGRLMRQSLISSKVPLKKLVPQRLIIVYTVDSESTRSMFSPALYFVPLTLGSFPTIHWIMLPHCTTDSQAWQKWSVSAKETIIHQILDTHVQKLGLENERKVLGQRKSCSATL